MKKKYVVFLILFLIVALCSFVSYHYTSPKAQDIDYPDYNQVETINVYNAGKIINLSEEDCEILYRYICEAVPTRSQSVHETPYTDSCSESYYSVMFNEKFIVSYGYIYKNKGKVFWEVPYLGVYKLDKEALELLENY